MKTFKEILTETSFKKGDKVKIKNIKSYDSLAKTDTGTVIGMMDNNTVMVKVGTGQINAKIKDIELKESIDESLAESSGIKIDKEDCKMFLGPITFAMSGISGYTKNTKKFTDLFFKYNQYMNRPSDFIMPMNDFNLAFGVLAYVANTNTAWASGSNLKKVKAVFDKYQERFSNMNE